MTVILVTNTPIQIGYLKSICETDIIVYSINAKGHARSQFISVCDLLGLKYCGNVRSNVFKFVYLASLLTISRRVVYFGDYNSRLCKLLVKIRANLKHVSHYLADGGNVCRFIERSGSKQKFNTFYTYMLSAMDYDSRFEYRKLVLPDVLVGLNPVLKNSLEQDNWILGSPDVVDSFITIENYLSKLTKVCQERNIIYLAHRREQEEDLEKINRIVRVIKLDYNIEWIANSLSHKKLKNKVIYHFGSTAAMTLIPIIGTSINIRLIPYEKDDVSKRYWPDYQSNIELIRKELELLAGQNGKDL